MILGSLALKSSVRGLFAALAFAVLSAPTPARAEVYGGIELGAKGIKAVVLDITVKPEGNEIAVLFSASANVGLGASVGADDRLEPKAVADAAAAVQKFVVTMKDKHSLKPGSISVVGSSGLFASLAKKPEAVKENQKLLAEAVTRECGLPVAYIDAAREAALTIDAVVPGGHLADGLSIDVGGGNTKGGFLAAKGTYATFASPYGTSSFAEAVKKAGGDFPEQCRTLRTSVLKPALEKSLPADAKFGEKKYIYLSGGVVWATATLIHPADRSTYTPLTAADFDAMEAFLAKGAEVGTPDLSGIADAAVRAAAEKEIGAVKKVYTRDQLIAGVQILKALSSQLELGSPEKKLLFPRNAQIGWISAYVAEKADRNP